MYKSPIELLIEEFDKKIVKKQDADIYQAVLSCGINVDKDELIRALEYDRAQYENGFRDGVASVTDNNVGCKWIPVNERLPGEEGCYLVYTARGSVCTGHFYTEKQFHTYYTRKPGWSGRYIVTHWMPLPEPPKEDEK